MDQRPAVAPSSPPAPALAGKRRRDVLLGLSALLALVSGWALATQPESWAWLMIFPRWTWLLCGVALWGLGFSRSRRWPVVGVALLWGLHTAWNVEEPRSLLRAATAWWPASHPAAKGFRVCTFNCGSGEEAAIREALSHEPELIFLQESPQQDVVRRMAERQWGDAAAVAWSPDAVIAARGGLTLRQRSPAGVWIWVTWHRGDGREDVEVVSLRLHPVPLRFDFWNRDCWHALAALRQTHRREIAELLAALGTLPAERPCLIGGDFNAPAHDASLADLEANFRDAFDEAGTGWGNTIVNGMTVQRIDQVWVNTAFRARFVRAVTSRHSDHALVLCDLVQEALAPPTPVSKSFGPALQGNSRGSAKEDGTVTGERR